MTRNVFACFALLCGALWTLDVLHQGVIRRTLEVEIAHEHGDLQAGLERELLTFEIDVRASARDEGLRESLESEGTEERPIPDEFLRLAHLRTEYLAIRLGDADGQVISALGRDESGDPLRVPASSVRVNAVGPYDHVGFDARVSPVHIEAVHKAGALTRVPVVTLSTWVTGGEGSILGVLELDIDLSDSLQMLDVGAHTGSSQLRLVSVDGAYLLPPGPDLGTSPVGAAQPPRFDLDHAALWASFLAVDHGVVESEEETFIFRWERAFPTIGGPRLLYVSCLPNSLLAATLYPVRRNFVIFALAGFLGLCTFFWLRERSRAERVSVIAALREGERRYRRSEERFRVAFMMSPDSLSMVRLRDSVMIDCNQAFLDLVDYHRQEVVGQPIPEIGIWADPSLRESFIEEVRRTGSCKNHEIALRTREGAIVPAIVSARLVEVDGEPCSLAIARDVRERKRVERALLTKTEELEAIYRAYPDLQLRLANDGTILDYQTASTSLPFPPREELMGELLQDVLPPDLREAFETHLAEARRSGAISSTEYEFENEDGLLAFEVRLVPFKQGEFLAIARNITDRKTSERERIRLEERLREVFKMEALGQLAGGVAHDFNNILTVITGHSQLLRSRFPEDDAGHVDLNQIDHAAKNATSLTRQLLAFSRRQVISPEWLDPNQLIERMKRIIGRLMRADIEFALDLSPKLWAVRADAGTLEQAVINLALNAVDAMPQGGEFRITTRNRILDRHDIEKLHGLRPGLYVVISVSDTGVGMSEERRARAFEPFFTTKDAGRGTGLGLASVYGIVRQSEGEITIESEPGEGATFHIYLPATRAQLEDVTLRPQGMGLRGNETILICEDEPGVRGVMRDALAHRGYRVLESETPEAALTLEDEHEDELHLLISDIVMPVMTGGQLAETLRARRPGLKVLFVSGYTLDIVNEHGGLGEEDAFIPKPFTPRELLERVRQLLDSEVRVRT